MPASCNRHGSIFKAWRNWKDACLSFADSEVCTEHELKRRARYLGIPIAQLRWVPSYSPEPIGLLQRRMEALSLDLDDVTRTEPLVLQKLQHRCIKCERRGQCALELADKSADPASENWRDYCPNAATLSMLSTLQSCSKACDLA
jgi:uncharacterized protein DUF6455